MRSFFLTAVAVVTLGIFGVQTARADWQENILGVPVYKEKSVTHAYGEPTARESRRASRRSARQARRAERRNRSTRRSRRAARSGNSRSWGGSTLSGLASYYWQPQRVASGGWFNPNALTAAHKTLPFGTRVRVTNLRNGRSVVVRINDRGPYVRGRIIDLSSRAAGVVGMKGSGVVPVRVAVLGR
ncbi:MAG TPA: septal ring lytic transglycosylase RlpA family protein [Hyphomicrobiaceae bacterium]|nr:septal ring lytic transglycosylase RlpA family protein [Hyphomicrobiaceae bacterium]